MRLTALGSSSLYSTVEDLAKWILNFDDARIGGQVVVEQMHQQGVLNNGEQISYAFGLDIGEYRALKTVGHGGSWRGFRSHLIRFPAQKFGVVTLCNLDTFNPLNLARKIADLYLADVLAPKAPEPDTQPLERNETEPLSPELLSEFEGDYYTEELDTTYTIGVRGTGLTDRVAQHRRHDDISLTYADGHFVGDAWFFPEVYFSRDDTGQITGFRLTGNRVKNLRFKKKTL